MPSQRTQLLQKLKSGQGIELDFYSYTFNVASLAAAASDLDSISIQANASFVVVKSTYFADIAGAAQTDSSRVIPLVTVALTDSGSGRNLQNAAVPINSIGGPGQLPFIWPQSRLLMASSTITATFINYSAATTYVNLYYTLIGYQVFEY
jgi:hypothetical protein